MKRVLLSAWQGIKQQLRISSIFNRWFDIWRQQSSISKISIFCCLALIFFAYLPSMRFDYVPEDQWRAFRYDEHLNGIERGNLCADMNPRFFTLTGRPFVWFGECIEHTIVSKIHDFSYLRPVMVLLTMLIVLYLGRAMGTVIGGLSYGITAATLVVMAPGFSFMMLQGFPALMVLIGIILSAQSFFLISNIAEWKKPPIFRLIIAAIYFLFSCYMYPAYTFIAVSMVLFGFICGDKGDLTKRFKTAFCQCVFYGLCTVLYYISVKLMVWWISRGGQIQDLGGYKVEAQSSPEVILSRLKMLWDYLYHFAPVNFEAPFGSSILLILLPSLVAAILKARTTNVFNWSTFTKTFCIFSAATVLITIVSTAPWLFSTTNDMSTRHFLGWSGILSMSAVFILSVLAARVAKQYNSLLLVALLVVPTCIIQNHLTYLEAKVSNIEIEVVRADLKEWVKNEGWKNDRYILFATPQYAWPKEIDPEITEDIKHNENVRMALSGNEVLVPWMVRGVLRELLPHDFGFKLVECQEDISCAANALLNPKNVVVGFTKYRTYQADKNLYVPQQPHMINISLLTNYPYRPVTIVRAFPKVTASSQIDGNDDLGPFGLLGAKQPGWHAAVPAQFPQTVTIDFTEEKTFRTIELHPQDGMVERMPKAFTLLTSSDGINWKAVDDIGDVCNSPAVDGWQQATLKAPVKARYIQLKITSNCGNPSLLTLRGLRFK